MIFKYRLSDGRCDHRIFQFPGARLAARQSRRPCDLGRTNSFGWIGETSAQAAMRASCAWAVFKPTLLLSSPMFKPSA